MSNISLISYPASKPSINGVGSFANAISKLNFAQYAGDKYYLDRNDILTAVRNITRKDPDDIYLNSSDLALLQGYGAWPQEKISIYDYAEKIANSYGGTLDFKEAKDLGFE